MNGKQKVMYSLTKIRDVGRCYSNLVTNVDGKQKVMYALTNVEWQAEGIYSLTNIKSVGRRYSNLVTNVDGKQKVALPKSKGAGRRYSNLVYKKADVDLNKRYAHIC